MRKAAATPVLALFPLFLPYGLAPAFGHTRRQGDVGDELLLCGKAAQVPDRIRCATSTVSTPMASIWVISTPLIRYALAELFGVSVDFLETLDSLPAM